MNDNESTQLVLGIIDKALDGQPQPFRQILYWSEFRYYSRLNKSNKLVIRILKTSADNLFKEYCKDVVSGTSSIYKILAYAQLLDIIAFYERDFDTVKKMLDDYDEYLGKGHFWYSFLGGRRE
jgi:hypothetical protein